VLDVDVRHWFCWCHIDYNTVWSGLCEFNEHKPLQTVL